MPMTYECVVAVLAVGMIGAIYIPIFSGYAADAIAGRLRACDACVLICANGFYRRGQIVPMKATADAAGAALPSISHVIVAERVDRAYVRQVRDVTWTDVVNRGLDPNAKPTETLAFEDTSAEDPFMVIYTSGTTGKPKGAVHVHGGFPVKAAQDPAHCLALRDGEFILGAA